MTLTISGVQIGGDAPCRFVFEASNAHNGSLSRCLKLVDAAKEAGADFFKTQAFTPEELVQLRGDGPAPEPWGSRGWTMRTLYEKAQTPLGWLPAIKARCGEVGMGWMSSVFGLQSLAVLESLDVAAYKIARLDSRSRSLLAAVCSVAGAKAQAAIAERPVMVSTEGSLDVEKAAAAYGAHLLYCPPKYPTPLAEVRLPRFNLGDEASDLDYVGLSSHCLDARLPVAAVARGAKLIEMHGMLDDEPSELEADVSLTASQFRRMVDDVRATEAMLA